MRIDCDACGAAYAIDDTLVTPRGVRAQCPKCAHQKIVRATAEPERTPFGAASTPPFDKSTFPSTPEPPASNDAPSPFGVPAPNANPFAASPSPFGGAPASPQSPSPFGAPATDSAFGAASESPFGVQPSPFGGTPAQAPSPFGAAEPAPSPFGAAEPAPSPFGAPDTGANPFAEPQQNHDEPALNPFATPDKPVADPFDIGLNHDPGGDPSGDELSYDQGPSFEEIMASAPPPSGGLQRHEDDDGRLWRIKTNEEGVVENLTFSEVSERIRQGTLESTNLLSEMGSSWKRADAGPFADQFSATVVRAGESRGIRSRGGLSTTMKAAIALVVVAGLVGALYVARPNLFSFKKSGDGTPFARAENLWRSEFPQSEGSADEQVLKAQTFARLDTAQGYKRADEHFRMAILTDNQNTDAIAGYVRNFSKLPNAKANASGTALALDGVDWALSKEPKNHNLLGAKAALRLMMDDVASVDDARDLLDAAITVKGDDPTLQLMQARSHLERNPKKALALSSAAMAKSPDMIEALTVKGGAQRRLGDYEAARKTLQQRLEKDESNASALRELSALEVDTDHIDVALVHLQTLLEAEKSDIAARLMRAKLLYQFKAQPSQAMEVLQTTIDEYQKDAGDLLLSAETHLGFVKGLLLEPPQDGRPLVEAAKKRDSSYAPALFALGQLNEHSKSPEAAIDNYTRAHSALRPTLSGPKAGSRLGHAEVAFGNRQAGLKHLNEAIKRSPRDIDIYFTLANAHLQAGENASAFTIMKKALDIEPDRGAEMQRLTDFPEAPSFLQGLAKSFHETIVSNEEKPLQLTTEAMIYYQLKNFRKASGLLRKALVLDKNNPGALLYSGAIALRQGRVRAALKVLRRGHKVTGGTHVMTRVYLARALYRLKKYDEMLDLTSKILDDAPANLQARLLNAKVRSQKEPESARVEMQSILKESPAYGRVRRALDGEF